MNERELNKLYRDTKSQKAAHRWMIGFVKTRDWYAREDALIKMFDGSDPAFQVSEKKHSSLEPVDWIERGIDHFEDSKQRFALYKTVSRIMDLEPDVDPLGANPDRLLFNLLHSTMVFYQPEDLASRIEAMCRREALIGQYKGQDLSNKLIDAMQYNQIDHRYLSIWKAVLDGENKSWMPITPEQAMHGVLWVPESSKERGKPNIPELGKAWVKYAALIERDFPKSKWAKEFNNSVEDALGTYPGRPQWEDDLYAFTQLEGWRPWMSRAKTFNDKLETRDRMQAYRQSLGK